MHFMITSVRATVWQSFNSVMAEFLGTGIMVAVLRQIGWDGMLE